jgi:hypothetical protein
VAVKGSGEVGRSAVYSRYSKGPRTLPWGTPALTGVRPVSSVWTLTTKWRLDRQELRMRKQFSGSDSLSLYSRLVCQTLSKA